MKGWKRLLYYVLINIVVSAATTLVVLKVWERTHPPLAEVITPTPVSTPSQTAALATSAPAAEVTEQAAAPTDALLPSETPRPAPTLELIEYKIKSGDTLGSIAVEFDISMADILAVNTIDDPDNLSVGQLIYIPTGPVPIPTATAETPPTPAPSATRQPSATPTAGPSPTASATLTGSEPGVNISSVIGAGDLNTERVVLIRTGDGELDMAGWRLEDSSGQVFTFPQLTLYKDGAVNIYTRAGQNTVVDLYWGLAEAVWQSGETVTLYDAQGSQRATYKAP